MCDDFSPYHFLEIDFQKGRYSSSYGKINVQRCGDSQIIASIDSNGTSPMNCISEVLNKAKSSGRSSRYGYYNNYYGCYQNLLNELVTLAGEKTSFISLRTYISDSMPAVWSQNTHLLFPGNLQLYGRINIFPYDFLVCE